MYSRQQQLKKKCRRPTNEPKKIDTNNQTVTQDDAYERLSAKKQRVQILPNNIQHGCGLLCFGCVHVHVDVCTRVHV